MTKNIQIRVDLERVKTYSLNVSGSNTVFTYSNSDHRTGDGDRSWNFESGTENVEFKIRIYSQHGFTRNGAALNKLTLTIGNETKALLIPGESGTSATGSARTIFSDGTVVEVKYDGTESIYGSDFPAGDFSTPKYIVSVSNGNGIYDNISVSTNYMSKAGSEVWVKSIDGIMPVAYTSDFDSWLPGFDETNYVSGSGRLTPNEHRFISRDNGTDYYLSGC